MNVWVEKFNHEARILAQRNPRFKKKFAFSQHFVVRFFFSFFVLLVHKQMDFKLTPLIHLCRICLLLTLLHSTSMVA
jgi:hypothetical protein